jgi:hypothetical protein
LPLCPLTGGLSAAGFRGWLRDLERRLFFFEKENKSPARPKPNAQKFFASFFQKRRPCLGMTKHFSIVTVLAQAMAGQTGWAPQWRTPEHKPS